MCAETTNRHFESQFSLTITFFQSWCCCRPEYVYWVGWGPLGNVALQPGQGVEGHPVDRVQGRGGQPDLTGRTLLCYMDTEACTGRRGPPGGPHQAGGHTGREGR